MKGLNDTLGITSVLVSHDIQETLAIADYIYIIADGKLLAQGTKQQLLASTNRSVVQFLHGHSSGPLSHELPTKDLLNDFS